MRRPLHWSRQWWKWTWRREVRFWINSEGGTDRFADRSNEEGGEQKSICYESVLEKLRGILQLVLNSVVVKSKDSGARWPGCKSNFIAYCHFISLPPSPRLRHGIITVPASQGC